MGYLKGGNEMAETSTSRTTGARFSAARVPLILRLICAGAAGPLILLLAATVTGIASCFLGHGPGPLDLLFFVPLWAVAGGWMLLPYWGALRLQRRAPNTPGKAAIVLLAVVLVIALGATSFLVTSAFVLGWPHPPVTARLQLAVLYAAVIPILQWAVLYAAELLLYTAALLLRLLGLVARRRTRHSGNPFRP